jgi:hypothetical protein
MRASCSSEQLVGEVAAAGDHQAGDAAGLADALDLLALAQVAGRAVGGQAPSA